MFNQTFYHGAIRKAIVAFGNLFSGITIKSRNTQGEVVRTMEVPISYARKQQWLQRLQGDSDFQKKFETEIPRMSFEIESYQYFPEKKIGNQYDRLVQRCNLPKAIGAPVPYRLIVSLSTYSKNTDDALQILEQILPYFAPTLNINIEAIPEFNFYLDIPVTLQGVSDEDNYQDINNNRMIIQTFTFAVDVQLFGPTDEQLNIIKETVMNMHADTANTAPILEVGTNTVVPREANKTDIYTIESLWTVL